MIRNQCRNVLLPPSRLCRDTSLEEGGIGPLSEGAVSEADWGSELQDAVSEADWGSAPTD